MKRIYYFVIFSLLFSCNNEKSSEIVEKDLKYYFELHRKALNEELMKKLPSHISTEDFVNFCLINAWVVSGLDGEFEQGQFRGLHGAWNSPKNEFLQVQDYYRFLVSTGKLGQVKCPLDLVHLSFYPKAFPKLNLVIRYNNLDLNRDDRVTRADLKIKIESSLKNHLQLFKIYQKYQ